MNDQLEYYKAKLAYEMDAWDLDVALNAGEAVTVIDARSAEAYGREHLPGAISLPHRQMNEETTRNIRRDSLVVTYCDGIGCNASTKGALRMLELGFCVRELIGGLDWWKRDSHATHCGAGDASDCGCG